MRGLSVTLLAGLVLLAWALAGCTIAPPATKVTDTRTRDFIRTVDRTERPLEIGEFTTVLDTRPHFAYGLNHVVNSQHFLWSNLAEFEATGELLRDPRTAALRLALAGLNPQSQVVVVDDGPAGHGEAGRLAWNLLYLGFQDVQVSGVDALRKNMTPTDSPLPKNEPPWKPQVRDELQILEKNEILNLNAKPGVHLIDVRSEKEYLTRPKGVSLETINIEWKQFYTPSGRPDTRFKEKLIALGIKPEDRVVLISNRGVRSAAAAYALIALGYAHVQNFTPGWNSWKK